MTAARRTVEAAVLRTAIMPVTRWVLRPSTSWPERRKRTEQVARIGKVAAGVHVEHGELGGLPCEISTPTEYRDDLVLLYLHGGGWTVGSARTHRSLVSRLAARAQVRAWSIDYRLAPEHPYPAALEDSVAAYQALLAAGHTRIVVAGDSAGGGLTAALGLALRDRELAPPSALGLLCPGVDLTVQARDQFRDSWREPILGARVVRDMMAAYVGTQDPADPLISPQYSDLRGLPPIVMDSAGDDMLAAQDRRFAESVRAAGGSLDHHEYPGVWHVFHALAGLWPVATGALDEFADRLVAAARAVDG